MSASAVFTVPAVTNLPAWFVSVTSVATFGVIVTPPFASTVDTVNAVVSPLVIDFTPTFAFTVIVPLLFANVTLSPASNVTLRTVSLVTSVAAAVALVLMAIFVLLSSTYFLFAASPLSVGVATFVTFMLPALIPALPIVTVFVSAPFTLEIVTPSAPTVIVVPAAFAAPVPFVIEVMPVNAAFKLNLYGSAVVPVPAFVMFVPLSNASFATDTL